VGKVINHYPKRKKKRKSLGRVGISTVEGDGWRNPATSFVVAGTSGGKDIGGLIYTNCGLRHSTFPCFSAVPIRLIIFGVS
jgi:hypothetical protein